MTLDRSELLERLDYDVSTGSLTWKAKTKSSLIGKEAGRICKFHGYRIVKISQVAYPAHRLIWFYMNKVWPEFEIDHIDGDKLNNRIENLRDVPHSVNCQNKRRAQSDNKLGFQGVRKREGRNFYEWSVKLNGKVVEGGWELSAEKAHAAYVIAKRKHHIGCTI